MKTKILVPAALACLLATTGLAAPLTETTAVHSKPESSSPAITSLKAGTEPKEATAAQLGTPSGWMAVELPGPFQGYVEKKDMTKGLDVKPGTQIRLAPQSNGPVLTTAEKGDKTTITGLQGRWAQIRLEKNLVGYIKVATTHSPLASTPALPAPEAVATPVMPSNAPGQPAVASSLADSASLPRQLTGKFVSTRSALRPRRPYDWALEDNAGRRFAYVDISKLLLTEQIDKYIGRSVVVFGAARPTPDGKDIVIQVESLQLLPR